MIKLLKVSKCLRTFSTYKYLSLSFIQVSSRRVLDSHTALHIKAVNRVPISENLG